MSVVDAKRRLQIRARDQSVNRHARAISHTNSPYGNFLQPIGLDLSEKGLQLAQERISEARNSQVYMPFTNAIRQRSELPSCLCDQGVYFLAAKRKGR